MKYLRKLQTYWFILNHILEITDELSARVDALECAAVPKKRKSTKKPKEKK